MTVKISVTQVTGDGFDPTVTRHENGGTDVNAGGVALPTMTPAQWIAFCHVVDRCRMWGGK